MKKILLIATVYRVGERIYPIIPELSKFCELDIIFVNQMSDDFTWYGDNDMRNKFKEDYNKYFNKIYSGSYTSINPILNKIDFSKYDLTIYDDNRPRYDLDKLYNECNKNNCAVLGNIHGNWWINGKQNYNVDSYKKVFDYVSVFGNNERDKYDDKSYMLVGGIPSNDDLKYYERTNDYILIIVNYLGNRWSPYPITVNEEFIKKTKLLELQKKYNKKVVFKLKSRADHPYPQKDYDYIKSIVPKGLDYVTIMDFEDNNQLICGAFLVIFFLEF